MKEKFKKNQLVACCVILLGLGNSYGYAVNNSYSSSYPNNAPAAGYQDDAQTMQRSDRGHFSDQELQKKIRDKIGPGWFSSGYEKINAHVSNGHVTLEGVVKNWDDREDVEQKVRDIDGVRSVTSRIRVQDTSEGRDQARDRQQYSSNRRQEQSNWQQTNRQYGDRGEQGSFQNDDRQYSQDGRRQFFNDRGQRGFQDEGQFYSQDGRRSYSQDGRRSYSQDERNQYSNDRRENKYFRDTYASPSDEQLNKKIRDNVSNGWLWDSYEDIILHTSNGVVTLDGIVDDVNDQQKLINEIQKVEGVRMVKSNLRIQNR